MSTYGLDSIHINVGPGDSALHLLVQIPATGPRIVEKVILIDGAKSNHEMWQQILDTFTALENDKTRYKFTDDKLLLDTIIITHWDNDHYEGLLKLMAIQADKQLEAKKKPEEVIISFLKYKDNKPITTWYVPTWSGSPKDKVAQLSGQVRIRRPYNKGTWVPVAIAKDTGQKLLGMNFLNEGTLLTKEVQKNINSPADLLAKNPPVAGKPGMYCIAAESRIIGPMGGINGGKGMVVPGGEGVSFPGSVVRGGMGFVNDNDGEGTDAVETNNSSIVIMVIWSNGRLSHYFGGDAYFETEQNVYKWISESIKKAKEEAKKSGKDEYGAGIKSMKLSHHGATNSTPLEMLDGFDPTNVVISAGNKHGHPRWEALLYLHAWVTNKATSNKPVIPTRYPFYLLKEVKGGNPVFVRPEWAVAVFLDTKKEAFKEFVDALAKLTGAANDPAEQFKTFFKNALDPPPTKATDMMYKWMINDVEKKWPQISSISPLGAGAPGATSGSFNEVVRADKVLLYIKVQSRDSWTDDGEVFIRYKVGDEVDYRTLNFPVDAAKESKAFALEPPLAKGKRPLDSRVLLKKGTDVTLTKKLKSDPTGGKSTSASSSPDVDSDIKLLKAALPTVPKSEPPGDVVPTADTADTYYIYSSTLAASSGANYTSLTAGEKWDSFLDALNTATLSLSSTPAPSSTTPLISGDEWLCWLKDSVNATELSVVYDDKSKIGGFELKLKVGDGELTLSTDALAAAFSGPEGGVATAPSQGLIEGLDILVLGLDPTSSSGHTNVGDVLASVGLQGMLGYGAMIGLKVLGATLDTSEGNRNAMWFNPSEFYSTTLRLQYIVDKDGFSFLNFLPGLDITKVLLIVRRVDHLRTSNVGKDVVVIHEPMVSIIVSCDIDLGGGKTAPFEVELDIKNNSFTAKLRAVGTDDILEGMLSYLGQLANVKEWDFQGWLKKLDNHGLPQIRSVELDMQLDENKGTPSIKGFEIDMEMSLDFGKSDPAQHTLIFISYQWSVGQKFGTLMGTLWRTTPNLTAQPPGLFMSDWDSHLEQSPKSPNAEKRNDTLGLATLIPSGGVKIENVPEGIPNDITQAWLLINDSGIQFFGQIECTPPKSGKVPKISLDSISLAASYGWTDKTMNLACSIEVELIPMVGATHPDPAKLTGDLVYDSDPAKKSWEIHASVSNLYASTLWSFFDSSSQQAVMDILDHIFFRSLDLKYIYQRQPGGGSQEFHFTGSMLFGELELDVKFDYDSNGWTIVGELGADQEGAKTTVGSIIESLAGANDVLPGFVANIEVGKSGGKDGLIKVECKKVKPKKKSGGTAVAETGTEDSDDKPDDGKLAEGGVSEDAEDDPGSICFSATVHISKLTFTFTQYRSLSWAPGTPPKRVLKISVVGLPEVDVPLIGNLTQPFDEMFFMWVQDNTKLSPNVKLAGLTREEADSINEELGEADHLLWKEKSQTPAPKDVVCHAGAHFVLVLKDSAGKRNVVIDYLFNPNAQKKQTKSIKASSDNKEGEEDNNALVPRTAKEAKTGEEEDKNPSDSKMAPLQKSMGPLSISNIGFQYKDGKLGILLDATLIIGPVGFSILGFSINLDLQKFDLHSIDITAISVAIQGLAVAFNKPPIELAGEFKHVGGMYSGGIIIGFTPYMFEAAGFYGQPDGPGGYTSIFIFAKLNGPLVTLEFAEISGITGGFGYNVDIKFPTPETVTKFPFLAMDTPQPNLIDTLKDLTSGVWFNPKDGSFWLAAGLKVDAFQMLAIDAVAVIEWNPAVKLGLFGVAVADIPGPSSPEHFAHVELGISATVDFDVGLIALSAQLSPNSYILDPNCHLTGGFALYYWFNAPHSAPGLAGDWVFTIGGYHKSFTPPSQYPNPPRLGISWSVDSAITITGQSYFAITPKVCMGGGHLHAAMSVGALGAFFDAYADFLIQYHPFYFSADGGISVGVTFTMDVWFVTIHISVEIGATLYLYGPPIAGRVHVNFWVFGFDVNFGAKPSKPDPLPLPKFYSLALQAGEPVKPAEKGQDHIFSCTSGLMQDDTGKQETPVESVWNVRAGVLCFRIACRFAIQEAVINELPDKMRTSLDTPIYGKPMQLKSGQDLTSTLAVEILRSDETKESVKSDSPWEVTPLLKDVPKALWAVYDEKDDPTLAGNNIKSLLDGKGVAETLLMGIIVWAPKPVLSDDKIGKFNAVEAMKEDVFVQGDEPVFPAVKAVQGDWNPAPYPGGELVERWKAVEAAWKAPKQDPVNIVKDWVAAFGWENDLEDGKRKGDKLPWQPLNGNKPEKLVDGLEGLWLAAARICV